MKYTIYYRFEGGKRVRKWGTEISKIGSIESKWNCEEYFSNLERQVTVWVEDNI